METKTKKAKHVIKYNIYEINGLSHKWDGRVKGFPPQTVCGVKITDLSILIGRVESDREVKKFKENMCKICFKDYGKQN